VHDLSRCGYTDDGHAPSSQGAPGRLPGRPAACRSRSHIYSFLLVRVPRPGAEGLLAFGIGSEAGPTRASDPTRCRCRVLAVRGVDSFDGPLPGLPAGISAWSGNGMTGNGGPCVDTRGRVRACLLRRRVPNESSTTEGAMAKERDWPTAPSTVNSHRSNGTLGVGPADSTGNLCPHTVQEGPGLHRRQYVGGRGSRGRSAACRYVSVR